MRFAIAFGFAIGVGLLATGWGGMRYAHEQQMTFPADRAGSRFETWSDIRESQDWQLAPTFMIMLSSVVTFGSGAFLVALCGPSVIRGIRKNPKDISDE